MAFKKKRCKGKTQYGGKCMRWAIFNGYCFQHLPGKKKDEDIDNNRTSG